MVNSKKFKKLIAFISAVCMTSVCMLSVSADTIADSTQSIVQQDENVAIENELFNLGFSQDEVNLIIKSVDSETIQSVLNYTGEESISARGTVTTDVYHLQDSNGNNVSTYSDVASFNKDGSCGSLASAIALKYYKDYKGVNVPNCTTANFYNFYRSLVPYVEVVARSSDLEGREIGLNRYFKEKNISLKVGSVPYDASNPTTSIKKMILINITLLHGNNPTLASGKYNNEGHVVVIQGMKVLRNSNGDTVGATIEVNTGWGYIANWDLAKFSGYSGKGIQYFL